MKLSLELLVINSTEVVFRSLQHLMALSDGCLTSSTLQLE